MGEIRSVPASHGWAWLVRGWQLFIKNPAMWIFTVLVYFVITVVLSLIPVLGGLILSLIAPALTGGLLFAAREMEEGRAMEIGHLFQAFRDKTLTGPMLTLGLVSLGFAMAGGLVMVFTMGGFMSAAMMAHDGMQTPGIGVLSGSLAGLLILFVVSVGLFVAMFYGIPLVMFGRERPLEALRTSISASFANVVPMLVLSVVYLVLAFIAAIPFGLGFLVLVPLTAGAVYASYVDVCGC